MGKFDKDSIIKFAKTNSVDFAAEFPWFNEWLQKNASKIIEWEKRSILRPNRNPVIPSFPEGTPVAVLNRTYFLDDIKTVFFRGIPYSCSEDFITRADFTDSSVFSVDASTRTLLIPNPVNFAPKVEYEDKDSEFTVVGTVDQQDSKIKVSHKSLSDVKLEKVMPNVFDDSTGIKDGDTIAEAMTKINDSICWIDLEDDPSVFTTNEGDRLLYNNEWFVLSNE